jgi:RHH-type proline utilization regulon transcriptional repressor/proline dehydrogenase/delta 1-pyrroline-5-carboxylate dehydrogenase
MVVKSGPQKKLGVGTPQRTALCHAYRADETQRVTHLIQKANLDLHTRQEIKSKATHLVNLVRQKTTPLINLEEFLQTYTLSSEEGIVLMCLAEALLRIPDPLTADKLIRDKITQIEWDKQLGKPSSWIMKASNWGLALTGKILGLSEGKEDWGAIRQTLGNLISRSGEPMIRQAIRQGMKILGRQFVMATTIEDALKIAEKQKAPLWRHSYDMLGEGARTAQDGARYYASYVHAIKMISQKSNPSADSSAENPGISIKLSALHPRYSFMQQDRIMKELLPKVLELVQLAKEGNMGLTIDAEEADRLDISLDMVEALFQSGVLKGWDGLGMAVQAYQKRAPLVIQHLTDLARTHQQKFMIRLVKGAYWDTEIKMAQDQGLSDYPVFTRKESTDISYIACARQMLENQDILYSQFATHNAYTIAAILEISGAKKGQATSFEFQRLYGMGEALHSQIIDPAQWGIPCRVYAPIGSHQDLLAYLVRRLLENGANSSFVHKLNDPRVPIDEIVEDPITLLLQKTKNLPLVANDEKSTYDFSSETLASLRHPAIPLPQNIYGSARKNAPGIDLANPEERREFYDTFISSLEEKWQAAPILNGVYQTGKTGSVMAPHAPEKEIGKVTTAEVSHVHQAFSILEEAGSDWASPQERAEMLHATADILEENYTTLLALCAQEAGKVIADGIAEVREAIDFCRYYATQVTKDFVHPLELKGITGEKNLLWLRGRGTFVCISPWNFPLAIFMGQIGAALAAGNTVIAKPAESTPLIGAFAVSCFYKAGIPKNVLQFLPGSSSVIGEALLQDPRVAGVVFTGSTDTARRIQKTLAEKEGPIVPFIAETGGLNAMIIDSSSLMEQVVDDVIRSAFHSAGQRCSALRLVYVQEDVADSFIHMLKGAMDELKVGDPTLLSTDIGPVINAQSKASLEAHCRQMHDVGHLVHKIPLPSQPGHYVAPRVFELQSGTHLTQEAFGPILHMVRFKGSDLPLVVAEINKSGYGLTLGIHSRINSTVDYITQRARVGNIYVNRNMIGAVVGVQPFGGEGLSGTGPKAGGPHYLRRFATERVVTYNTTASGGNTDLLSLAD